MSDRALLKRATSAVRQEGGFTILEFLMASAIFLVISAAIFSMMAESQRSSSYQTEVQNVMDNTRLAMTALERYISQAGNDPRKIGLTGVTIVGPQEVRIQADLTGSGGALNPDKGDPDGDTADSGEDITIRYNTGAKSIEIVPAGGAAQTLANYISAFSMDYSDEAGGTTTDGSKVRKIRISLAGATTLAHPQTGKIYSLEMASDVELGGR